MSRQIINYLLTISTAMQILTSTYAAAHHHPGQALPSPQFPSLSGQGVEKMDEEEYYKELNRVGSRPPNCRLKCGVCTPCIAIQVPKNTDNVKVEYANYEPMGWKCKCGSALFSP